ncbi:STAS domain-containing protein [Amycolatopsis thermoflava]|uniref:Anti-sigma factor antagonist n=1 Tax=Amycolatopsis thermoflava TaxID=84480 RepID=A0A3N2GMI5_9PSEU|nr:STAS domain-containing protein [Amycolatopsis thermoflava]ROS37858.1 anti-anti-sigma factor [Amycolatopsis thermoflava]
MKVMQSRGSPQPGPGAPFAVTVQEREAAVVVHTSGELDASTVPRLRAIMRGVLSGAPAVLVVDLSGVTFLGSAGMHLLLEIQNLAGDTEVRVVADAHSTVKPLRLTRLVDVLDLYPTLAQALRQA